MLMIAYYFLLDKNRKGATFFAPLNSLLFAKQLFCVKLIIPFLPPFLEAKSPLIFPKQPSNC